MKESVIDQEMVAEATAKGRAEGLQQGLQQEVTLILCLLRRRIGEIDTKLRNHNSRIVHDSTGKFRGSFIRL